MTDDKKYPDWFDSERAASFVGKYVLIGINHRNSGNEIVKQRQDHGEIVLITPEGMVIQRPDGSQFSLPPCYWELQEANAGTYKLHGTGETVSDPDYTGVLSFWSSESQGN